MSTNRQSILYLLCHFCVCLCSITVSLDRRGTHPMSKEVGLRRPSCPCWCLCADDFHGPMQQINQAHWHWPRWITYVLYGGPDLCLTIHIPVGQRGLKMPLRAQRYVHTQSMSLSLLHFIHVPEFMFYRLSSSSKSQSLQEPTALVGTLESFLV
jgi:hypothetical protein